MINTADEAKKLLKAICDAKQAVETAKQEAITKEKGLRKSKRGLQQQSHEKIDLSVRYNSCNKQRN